MYTRQTPSRQIASEVIDAAAQYGHVQQECGYKQTILSYLDEHGSADTLGGWIDTVREYPNYACVWTMAFIWSHWYLRAMFPQDVLDEFAEIGVSNSRGAAVIAYVSQGTNLVPSHLVEKLPVMDDALYAMVSGMAHFGELAGTLDG